MVIDQLPEIPPVQVLTKSQFLAMAGRLDRSTLQKPLCPWLICPHRGAVISSVTGSTAGCGCSSAMMDVHQCLLFDEPVLKLAAARCFERIVAKIPSYTGRTCRECKSANHLLPIPDNGLNQSESKGIITGANSKHWLCLGALALSAYEQKLGFAVADHGLSDNQRMELDRIGVKWVKHGRPDLTCVKDNHKIASEIQAWWKPWICLASPFERSVWVDSDAAITGNLSSLLSLNGMQISTQSLWTEHGPRIYQRIARRVFGEGILPTLDGMALINSGVLAWTRGESLIVLWMEWCQKVINNPKHVESCRVRDQAGLMLTLIDLQLRGKQLPEFLPDEYNIPADYLPAGQSMRRKKIEQDPVRFLRTAKERHPQAIIVHWLGGNKPWK